MLTIEPHHVMCIEFSGQQLLNPAKNGQDCKRRYRAQNRGEIEADADEDADRSGDPDRCGSGQATYGQPLFEDYPSTKKADAGHNSLGHTSWISTNCVERGLSHPLALIDGHKHKKCRC